MTGGSEAYSSRCSGRMLTVGAVMPGATTWQLVIAVISVSSQALGVLGNSLEFFQLLGRVVLMVLVLVFGSTQHLIFPSLIFSTVSCLLVASILLRRFLSFCLWWFGC